MENKDKLLKKAVWGLIFGIIIYAGFAIWTDAEAVGSALFGFSFKIVAICLSLTVVNYSIRFLRWHSYLGLLNFEVSWQRSLLVFLSGLVMSITPGKVGEVLKSVLLKESDDLPIAKTAPIVLAERLTDLLGLIVVAGVGISAFDYGKWAFYGTLIFVIGFVVLVGQPRLVLPLLAACTKNRFLSKFATRFEEAYASIRILLSVKALIGATCASSISWGMEAFSFYLIVEALGGELPLQSAFFIYAMSTLIGGISFLPGGLGATEGSMITVLTVFGAFTTRAPAVAATYAIRFSTLWFGVFCGVFALFFFNRIMARSEKLKESQVNP